MSEKIRIILEDLYQAEPELKQYEKELLKAAEFITEGKSDAQFTEKFKKELREKLLVCAEEFKKAATGQESPKISRWADFKLWHGLSIVVIFILIAVLIILISIPPEIEIKKNEENIAPTKQGITISQAGEKAFGELKGGSASQTREMSGGGGGLGSGENTASSAPVPAVPIQGKSMITEDGTMPSYRPTVYEYVYKGEEIILDDEKAEVLKRVKGESPDIFPGIFEGLTAGLLDISKMTNVKVKSLTLTEDDDKGYEVSIDPAEGTAGININWNKWYDNGGKIADCEGDVCQTPQITDIPADQEMVEIANQFLNEYNINTSIYGQPVVDNEWRLSYERSENKDATYVPSQITVRYPLMINDKIVYEQWGNETGLNVSIDVKNKKVVGVYGLATQNYQSSSYESETDKQIILDFARRGGLYEKWSDSGNGEADVKEIELGAPRKAYMKYWTYAANQSEELIVSALVFPVIKIPEGVDFYRQNVVVPLVKDILNLMSGPAVISPPINLPVEMPQTEPAPAPDLP